jgi:hypothetical protein
MPHGRLQLALGEGLGRIHLEDLLGLLRLMKLSLSVWNHLLRVGRGRALIRSGICLVVRRLGGWRGLLVI